MYPEMTETGQAYEWLYQVLSADEALNGYVGGRIYRVLAPPDATMPYIIFQFQGGHSVRSVGPYWILSRVTCLVKVVGLSNTYQTLRTIADRVDELLQGASGPATGILSCVREAPVDYEETDGGTRYQHLGAQYLLYVQPG